MGCLSSSLLYGDTGASKTSQLGSFAKYVYKKTGKKSRLYTAEPGGLGTIQHLIDAGLIDVWDITQRPHNFETVDFAARGYWFDPNEPNKLVAPTPETYKEYGAFLYEGATAFGEHLLDELRVKGAANEIVGAERPPQQFTSGTMRVAGANQTFYGIAQARVRKAIGDSQRLPIHVMWTARELKVQDEESSKKQFVFGPMLVGSAATLMMPAWVANCIHIQAKKQKKFDPATKKETESLARRAYLRQHYDEGSEIPYLAQLRLPPEFASEMPDFIELTPDLESMVWLFEKIDELREKAKSLYAKK